MDIPVLGNFETLGVVGILATLLLFFMRVYFSKARDYEECLKDKTKAAVEVDEKLPE